MDRNKAYGIEYVDGDIAGGRALVGVGVGRGVGCLGGARGRSGVRGVECGRGR